MIQFPYPAVNNKYSRKCLREMLSVEALDLVKTIPKSNIYTLLQRTQRIIS